LRTNTTDVSISRVEAVARCWRRFASVTAEQNEAVLRHPEAAVINLIPSLSCRSCRPKAPFAELVQLSRTGIADEMRVQLHGFADLYGNGARCTTASQPS
jgi:hypothetical protein